MTSKVQPASELLTEHSASLNRAGINRKGRRDGDIRRDDEAVENSCLKVSAHHRHTSLGGDSRSLALHPINLNSKFDEFCSAQLQPSQVKASTKLSILSDLFADKESSFVSAPLPQNEKEVNEPAEELRLEPHETLMHDAQEEALSASFSIDSRSHCEEQFILWGNAAFCLSEGRDVTGSSVQRQRERAPEECTKFHSQLCEQKQNIKHLKFPSTDGGLLSLDHVIQPDGYHGRTVVSSCTCKTHHVSLAENEESVRQPSSVGSTFSHNTSSTASMTRQIQGQAPEDLSKESFLMSSDAQSCCLDIDAHELEASSASDCADGLSSEVGKDQGAGVQPQVTCGTFATSTYNYLLKDEVSSEEGKDQRAGVRPQVTCDTSATSPDNNLHQDDSVAADEEMKIRAELELEIERDLEQEIKTKIHLLTCRLEELHVLQVTRQPKQEQTDSQKVAIEERNDLLKNERTQAIKEALTKVTADNDSKRRSSVEQVQTSSQAEKTVGPQSKKQPLSAEKDVHLTYINTPVTHRKRLAMASGCVPHIKENKTASEVTLKVKAIKTPRSSTEGSATTVKSKVKVEGTSSFKHDYQSWTTSVASSKKFDWVRTLRLEFPSTRRVSMMKLASGSPIENAANVPPVKKRFGGHVARTLFVVGTSSTPAKAVTKLERRDSGMVVSTGKKKSGVSSCKPHGTTLDLLLPSTPHTRSTTSAIPARNSTKRVSQRPLDQQNQDSLLTQKPRAEATRQARIITSAAKPASVPRISPQQASSGKPGKIDKASNARVSPPTKQASLSANKVSSAHTAKPVRLPPAVSSSAQSVISKGSPTVVSSRASPQQDSCLPQISRSRVATSQKMATSATQVNKEK